MLYAIPSGGCFCPIIPPFCYGTSPTREGETMSELELLSKEKNAFGDMYYYIRDSHGVTNHVFEGDLDTFMKANGAKELKKGRSYQYSKKKGMER